MFLTRRKDADNAATRAENKARAAKKSGESEKTIHALTMNALRLRRISDRIETRYNNG